MAVDSDVERYSPVQLRDPTGTTTGGQFTSNPGGAAASAYPPRTLSYQGTEGQLPSPRTAKAKVSAKAGLPASASFKTLSLQGGNDPQAVKELQQLLTALGFNPSAGGAFDTQTADAVKAAQARLGIKSPNGQADRGLVTKLLNAYDLSPCVKRSEDDCDDTFTVTRSEGDVFDTLRESLETPDEIQAVDRASNPDQPYGNVEYADPGYQADGKKRYPIDSEAHCRAAWSYINQADNASRYSPEQLTKIKNRIKAAGKKYGIEFNDVQRGDQEILRYDRSWALDDIIIRSGGDGRTVEAYAAVFDTPSEIRDQHGHYMEVISRSAFNRAISHGINRINVFYNHGLTVHGTSDSFGSVPIGSPVDIQPDGRGLRTVTRFNRSTLADSVLEAIRAGDIRGYSFRGRIFQSNPDRVPRPRPGSALPTVTRTELGLAEYGPTPTPAYADAGILAVRSVDQVAAHIVSLSTDERAELVRMFTVSTPLDPETGTATPDVGPGTEDSPDGRSGRFQQFREELRKRGVLK